MPSAKDNVGSSLVLDDLEGPRGILSHSMPRSVRATIIRWLIGNVAWRHFRHDGEVCSEDFSRRHALECSGAEEYLEVAFPNTEDLPSHNILDRILNKYRQAKQDEFPADYYETIYNAICMIFSSCLHFQVMPSGWWKRGEG